MAATVTTNNTNTPSEAQQKSMVSDIVKNIRAQPKLEEEVEVDVPTDNLPPLDEVVLAMKAALKQRCLDVDPKNPVNPDEYFSEKHIAAPFWLPRKPEYGGKPWLDDALFMFAHSRAFDYDSASRRFFKFNVETKASEIQSFDEIPGDVAKTMSMSGLYYMPPSPDAKGRPIIYAALKHFTYADGYTLRGMKRASMWLFWQWCAMHQPLPQVNGLKFVMNYSGFGMAGFNMELKNWTDQVMQGMMPCKMSSIVLAYPPFWIDSLLWPIMRLVMKQKILDRIQWLGSRQDKVQAKFVMHTYHQKHSLFVTCDRSYAKYVEAHKKEITADSMAAAQKMLPLDEVLKTVPIDFGGTFDHTPENCRIFVEATWKVSDEIVPEGCYPEKKAQ